MNSLQGIDRRDPLFVSLNSEGRIREDFAAGSLEHGRIMEMYFGMD